MERAIPDHLSRTSAYLDPSGLPPAPVGNGDAALHQAARGPGPVALSRDDPARIVHDEAQRHQRDDARELARLQSHPSLRARATRRRATRRLFRQLEYQLAEITGFARVSLQPNAGSQGEYAGLLVIRSYHHSRGATHRTICLIPMSAHGTNPASAAMVGMTVVPVKSDAAGNVDIDDLRAKAAQHSDNLAALMVTYPSHARRVRARHPRDLPDRAPARRAGLHGWREHERAGRPLPPGRHRRRRLPPQSAQDLLHPARRRRSGHGAHRRGGSTWASSFRTTRWWTSGHDASCGTISAAPWGSAGILPISWAYINLLGDDGLAESTKIAILNANYIAAAPGAALPGALLGTPRSGGPRVHHRHSAGSSSPPASTSRTSPSDSSTTGSTRRRSRSRWRARS